MLAILPLRVLCDAVPTLRVARGVALDDFKIRVYPLMPLPLSICNEFPRTTAATFLFCFKASDTTAEPIGDTRNNEAGHGEDFLS